MEIARIEFERWYTGHSPDKRPEWANKEVHRDNTGNYSLMKTQEAWESWRAAWVTREWWQQRPR